MNRKTSKQSGPTQTSPPSITVLGFDPGSVAAGWGVVRQEEGRVLHAVAWGVIRPREKLLPEKLRHLFEEAQHIVSAQHPDIIAVEKVFWNPKRPGGLVLSHARGVLLLAATFADVPIVEIEPRTVKRVVTLFGGAAKEQIGSALGRLMSLPKNPLPHDAADALALAVTASLLSPKAP